MNPLKESLINSLLILVLLVALPAGMALAEGEQESDQAGERCINILQIKEVKVLDGQRILFRMSGGKSYINILPHRCSGLRKNQPFMYRTSLSRLCDLDIITVLDNGAFGLRPLGSCGLGRFIETSEEQIIPIEDDLKVQDQETPTENH